MDEALQELEAMFETQLGGSPEVTSLRDPLTEQAPKPAGGSFRTPAGPVTSELGGGPSDAPPAPLAAPRDPGALIGPSGKRPSFTERFKSNVDAGLAQSVLGSANIADLTDIERQTGFAPKSEEDQLNELMRMRGIPETPEQMKERLSEARSKIVSWNSMPAARSIDEYVAAIGGYLVGTGADPFTYPTLAVRMGTAAWRAANPLLSRLLNLSVGNAATNAALDPAVQANEVRASFREAYDPVQTAYAAAIGWAFGTGTGLLSKGAGTVYKSEEDMLLHAAYGGRKENPPLSPELDMPVAPRPDLAAPDIETRAVLNEPDPDAPAPKPGEEVPKPGEPPDTGVKEEVVITYPGGTTQNATWFGEFRNGNKAYHTAEGPVVSPRADVITVEPRKAEGEGAVEGGAAKADEVAGEPEIRGERDFGEGSIREDDIDPELRETPAPKKGAAKPSPKAMPLKQLETEFEAAADKFRATPDDDAAKNEMTRLGKELASTPVMLARLRREVRTKVNDRGEKLSPEQVRARKEIDIPFWENKFVSEFSTAKKAWDEVDVGKTVEAEGYSIRKEADGRAVISKGGQHVATEPDLRTAKAKVSELTGTAPRLKAIVGQSVAIESPREARAQGGVAMTPGAPTMVEPLQAAMRRIADEIELPVREGRISEPGAVGQFDFDTGIARLRSIQDFTTFAHEMAHAMHATLRNQIDAAQATHLAELQKFDPLQTDVAELGAEWMAAWVTNRARTELLAPNYTRDMRMILANNNPKLAAALDEAQAAYQRFRTVPSQVAAESQIVGNHEYPDHLPVNDPLERGNVQLFLSNWYRRLVDKNNPLTLAVDYVSRAFQKKYGTLISIPTHQDPSKVAQVYSDGGAGHAEVDMVHGIRDVDTFDVNGPSLIEVIRDVILDPATKKAILEVHDETGKTYSPLQMTFGAYLVARRAMREWERYDLGEIARPPTALNLGDHAQTIVDVERQFPHFRAAAEKVYAYNKELLRKEFKIGRITREYYDQLMTRSDYYVPFMRDMRGLSDEIGRSPGRTTLEKVQNFKFEGSDRRIIDPLTSMMTRTIMVNEFMARNHVYHAFSDLLKRLGGKEAARLGEFIPNHQVRAMDVEIERVLMQKAKDMNMDATDARAWVNDMMQDMSGDPRVTLYSREAIKAGSQPIIFGWRDGKREAIQLADGDFGRQLYETFDSLGRIGVNQAFQAAGIMFDIFTASAATLRWGATGTITFGVKNIVRDQFQQFLFLHEAGTLDSLTRFGKGFNSWFHDDDFYQMYKATGGIRGGLLTNVLRSQRINAAKILHEAGVPQHKMISFENLQKALRFMEWSETSGRTGAFRTVVEQNLAMGRSQHFAVWDGAHKARDLMDYGRFGSRMEKTAAMIPFLNAAVQGVDKFFRTYGDRLFTAARTAEELVEKQQVRKMLMTRVAPLAAMSTGLAMMYQDDPEYQRIPAHTRSQYWIFRAPFVKAGKHTLLNGEVVDLPPGTRGPWIFIPKPWEIGTVFNMAEYAVEFSLGQDPTAPEKFLRSLYYTFHLPSIFDNPLLSTVRNIDANWDKFFQRPIVPDRLVRLAPQFHATENTSKFAVGLAQGLNYLIPNGRQNLRQYLPYIGGLIGAAWSPMEAEHVARGLLGDWPREFGGVLGMVNSMAKGETPKLEDVPAVRAFFRKQMVSGNPSRDMWEQMNQANGRLPIGENTYKELSKSGRQADAEAYFRSHHPDVQDYIRLNVTKVSPDTRALHPLERAKNIEVALRDVRRQIDLNDGKVQLFSKPGTFIQIDADYKDSVHQVLGEIATIESTNALILMKTRGYEHKTLQDIGPYKAVIEQLAPGLAKEISSRYAFSRVYDDETMEKLWPELRDKLQIGAPPRDLDRIGAQAVRDGYEFGGRGRKSGARTQRFDQSGAKSTRGKFNITAPPPPEIKQ